MSSKEDIDQTFFFMAHTIPASIQKHFPNSHHLDLKGSWIFQNKWLLSLYMFVRRRISWPFLFTAEIYGLDFYWYLLRGLKLNYIEDAPFVFDIWETSSLYKSYQCALRSHPIKKELRKLLFGDYYLSPVGTSRLTKAIFASHPVNKPYYSGKPVTVINLQKAWLESSDEKKRLILSVFDISIQDLNELRKRDTIILTQPMYVDKVMNREEQISIYKKMLDRYGANRCIIKPHPRDEIDYSELFEDVQCFNKPVPMQLLSILGVSFKKVATVNSSAALSFGKDMDIDWWAEQLDYPRITDSGVKTLQEAKRLFK